MVRKLWERKMKGKRGSIGRVIIVVGKCLILDWGSFINFVMRCKFGEIGGYFVECIVGRELFFLCFDVDFCVLLFFLF